MSTNLNIPKVFLNDIQSRNPQVIPLVHIDLGDEVLKLSTIPLTVRDNIPMHDGVYQVEVPTADRPYHPLLLNITSILQKIDFFEKNFQTSSVNIEISDLGSLNLSSKDLFGKNVDIYFKSQSVRFDSNTYSHQEALSYCYLAYKGSITEVKIKNDILSIEIEDVTEKAMGELRIPAPVNDVNSSNVELMKPIDSKFIGKSLPYIFGWVDGSPCVTGGSRVYTSALGSNKIDNFGELLDNSSLIERDKIYFSVGDNEDKTMTNVSPFSVDNNGFMDIFYGSSPLSESEQEKTFKIKMDGNFADFISQPNSLFTSPAKAALCIGERKIEGVEFYVKTLYDEGGEYESAAQVKNKIGDLDETIDEIPPSIENDVTFKIDNPLGMRLSPSDWVNDHLVGASSDYTQFTARYGAGHTQESFIQFKTSSREGRISTLFLIDFYHTDGLYDLNSTFNINSNESIFAHHDSSEVVNVPYWNWDPFGGNFFDFGGVSQQNVGGISEKTFPFFHGFWNISDEDTHLLNWLPWLSNTIPQMSGNNLYQAKYESNAAYKTLSDIISQQDYIAHHKLGEAEQYAYQSNYAPIADGSGSFDNEGGTTGFWHRFDKGSSFSNSSFYFIENGMVDTNKDYFNFGFPQVTLGVSSGSSNNSSQSFVDMKIRMKRAKIVDYLFKTDIHKEPLFVKRRGFKFPDSETNPSYNTRPNRILSFLCDLELDLDVQQSGRGSIAHIDSLLERDWFMSTGSDGILLSAFDNQYKQDFSLLAEYAPENHGHCNYSFAIDQKVKIKSFIEEFSKETNLFPVIEKNRMKFIPIEDYLDEDLAIADELGTTIKDATKIIESNDVIKYNYEKSPINKVVNKLTIRYKKNYKDNSFTYSMSPVTAKNLLYDYDMSLYGERSKEIELNFIREGSTAARFALFYLLNNCNQHLIINMSLPLKYLHLELGDLIKFEELLGEDKNKPFGIDYTKDYNPNGDFANIVNGQPVFSKFLITKVKKDLDKIEISCIQLHKLRAVEDNMGCLDEPGTSTYFSGDGIAPEGNYEVIANTEDYQGDNPDITINTGCTGHIAGCVDLSENVDPDSVDYDGSSFFTTDTHPAGAGKIITLAANQYYCNYLWQDATGEYSVEQFDFTFQNGGGDIINVGTDKAIGYFATSDDNNLVWKNMYSDAPLSSNSLLTIHPRLTLKHIEENVSYTAGSFNDSIVDFSTVDIGDDFNIEVVNVPFQIRLTPYISSPDASLYKFDISDNSVETPPSSTLMFINILNEMIKPSVGDGGQIILRIVRPPWSFKDDGSPLTIDDSEYPYQYNPNWKDLFSQFTFGNIILFKIYLQIGNIMVNEFDQVEAPSKISYQFSLNFGDFSPTGVLMPGDVNLDGVVNDVDVAIVQEIASGSNSSFGLDLTYSDLLLLCDLNGDGYVNEDDVAIVSEMYDTFGEGAVLSESGISSLNNFWVYNHDIDISISNAYEITSQTHYLVTPQNTSILTCVYDDIMLNDFISYFGLSENPNEWGRANNGVPYIQLFINSCNNANDKFSWNTLDYFNAYFGNYDYQQTQHFGADSICEAIHNFSIDKQLNEMSSEYMSVNYYSFTLSFNLKAHNGWASFHQFLLETNSKFLIWDLTLWNQDNTSQDLGQIVSIPFTVFPVDAFVPFGTLDFGTSFGFEGSPTSWGTWMPTDDELGYTGD
tara:strand:+ start:559 stop:5577 length:5019 start_codon:yes stop_codon:yes gene_type:complete